MRFKLNVALSALVASGALGSVSIAAETSCDEKLYKDSYTIESSSTVTNGGHPILDGDDCIQLNGPKNGNRNVINIYSDSNRSGLESTGNKNRLINNGSIGINIREQYNPLIPSDSANILSLGNDNTQINNGFLSARGTGVRNMAAFGDGNTQINNGSLSAKEAGVRGMAAFGDGNTQINTDTGRIDVDAIGHPAVPGVLGGVEVTLYHSSGMEAVGAKNQMINEGTIDTTGPNVIAMRSSSSDVDTLSENYLDNKHRILLNGTNNIGMQAFGRGDTLINSDLMKLGELGTIGISLHSDDSRVYNNGTIYGDGEHAKGILTIGAEGAVIENHGRIYLEGSGIRIGHDGSINSNSSGIRISDSYGTQVLNGSESEIHTLGSASNGISVLVDGCDEVSGICGSSVTNKGSIETHGEYSRGIYIEGAKNTVINSGSVESHGENSYSIMLVGGDNTLTLNEGTELVGMVGLESSDTLNINMKQDMHLHTMGTPETINSDKTHVVVDDGIMFLDLAGYAAYDQVMSNTGSVVADQVGARHSGPSSKTGGSWANISGTGSESSSSFAGTWGSGDDEGTFIGVSTSNIKEDSSFKTDKIKGFHGGAYGKIGNTQYTLTMGLGIINAEHEFAHMGAKEKKMNSSAKAKYLSGFISPSLAWSGLLGVDENVRLQYTGIMHGAHDFDYGGGDKMKVDGRLSHEVKASVSWAQKLNSLPLDGVLRYGFDVGVMKSDTMYIEFNDKGANDDFAKDSFGRAFVGLDVAGTTLQVGYDNDDQLSIGAGATFQF